MKRIGKFFGVIGFLLPLLGLFSIQGFSQNVSVEASVSQTSIYAGERVRFSVEISGSFNNVSRPDLPSFNGLRLLSNTPSTSRSYRYVNGESSTSYTYTYTLIAQNEGSYKIPAASITIDGEEYQTDPIDVKVVTRSSSADESGSDREDIFLQLEVSDSQPVTGQQIITDVILFFRDGLEVNSYQPVPGWKAEGFWKEELTNSNRPQANSTIIDGVRYRKAQLLQFALFPTKSGELTISPYKIIVSVRSTRSRDDPFSSFFGGNQRQVELSSESLTLDVQPLPPAQDSNYLGAVGNFDISRSINTENTVVGETIELVTRIEGSGNVPLISKPDYDLPNGLEVYDPKQTTDINRENKLISGSQTFTDVLVPRSPGSYTIPQKEVSYFNPSQNQYVSTTLSALRFNVDENPEAVTSSSTPNSFPVSPVTGLASWTTPTSTDLLANWWLWIGLLLPFIVLGIAYWQKSFTHKMKTDKAFARSQKAFDKASDRLEKAISLSKKGNIKQAYNMLQKALTGFIGDRLALPEAGLSNAEYIEALKEEDVDENLIKNISMLLDKCASISYAPDTTHAYLKSHVGLAESTLNKLKKEL